MALRILILDNDPNSIHIITRAVCAGKFDSILIARPEEAAYPSSKPADLILADFDLLKNSESGFSASLKLVSRNLSVPVILGVAEENLEEVRNLKLPGIKEYISKPSTHESILNKIEIVVNQSRGSILIVDDEQSICDLLSNKLQNEGFRTLTAGDGIKALELLGLHNVKLVISDIQMPGMDGLQLTASIKQKNPAIPVLLITGYAGKYQNEDMVKAGASGMINKPFRMNEIIDAVKRFGIQQIK